MTNEASPTNTNMNVDPSNDDILVRIGLLERSRALHSHPGGVIGANDGQISSTTTSATAAATAAAPMAAVNVLRRLLESGKVSVQDAMSAVRSVQQQQQQQQPQQQPSDKSAASTTSCSDATMTNTHEKITTTENNTPKQQPPQQPQQQQHQQPPLPPIMEKYRTRHIALQFSYDGTDFSGFAENVGKDEDYSVEKALFAALEKTRLLVAPEEMEMVIVNHNGDMEEGGEEGGGGGNKGGTREKGTGKEESNHSPHQLSARMASKYSRCGRTDKGVHAHGQVVALYLKSAFPLMAKRADLGGQPGDLLKEQELPKNSLDGLECFVPPKKHNNKSKSKSKHKVKTEGKRAIEGNRIAAAPSHQNTTNTTSTPTSTATTAADAANNNLTLKTITEYDYARTLNNILPPSIRILGWCPVSPQFSARFSCSRRTYRYFFPRRNLDLSAMASGLQSMMGRHDFRNLCKMNCEQVYNFERVLVEGKVVSPQRLYTVSSSVRREEEEEKEKEKENDGGEKKVEEDVATMDDGTMQNEEEMKSEIIIQEMDPSNPPSPRDMCHVEIIGQAFLWHQIRCIMSILFYIGRKLEPPSIVEQLVDIQTNPAKPCYEMASETALVLHECTFGQLHLGRTVRNLWEVTKTVEQRWEKHAVAAERARDALESVKMETQVKWEDVVEYVEHIAKEKRRKERKHGKMLTNGGGVAGEEEIRQLLDKRAPVSMVLSWGEAMSIIQDVLGVYPYLPNGHSDGGKGHTESSIHVPLMERARGTTYEEKVQSILTADATNSSKAPGGDEGENRKSSKRRERYEENIIKKRKTTEEDKAFYHHMLQQGGSSS